MSGSILDNQQWIICVYIQQLGKEERKIIICNYRIYFFVVHARSEMLRDNVKGLVR